MIQAMLFSDFPTSESIFGGAEVVGIHRGVHANIFERISRYQSKQSLRRLKFNLDGRSKLYGSHYCREERNFI
jgi:hypothetical protein